MSAIDLPRRYEDGRERDAGTDLVDDGHHDTSSTVGQDGEDCLGRSRAGRRRGRRLAVHGVPGLAWAV